MRDLNAIEQERNERANYQGKLKKLEEEFMAGAGALGAESAKQRIEGELNKGVEESRFFFNNKKLITPTMQRIMNAKDANQMLKDEIGESTLRLKAAKYGHKISSIVPNHSFEYYLPDKTRYVD